MNNIKDNWFFKNREKFGWFNDDTFQQLIYQDKQQSYSDNFKK